MTDTKIKIKIANRYGFFFHSVGFPLGVPLHITRRIL